MTTQSQIEKAAGIDSLEIASYIMREETPAARIAMSCLKLCVECCEHGAFDLLKATVRKCKEEMSNENINRT
jgi:hypothetical protein